MDDLGEVSGVLRDIKRHLEKYYELTFAMTKSKLFEQMLESLGFFDPL
jgi:hypothetical protein